MNILKPYNSIAILKNIKTIFLTKDINKLNKPTYNFLSSMSGFIAHYNLTGFQNNYRDLRDLINDLKNSSDFNDPEREVRDPFFAASYGREYPKSKVAILLGLPALINQYEQAINQHFSQDQKKRELNIATKLAAQHGYKLIAA